jgi:hypothetical protein
MGTKSLEDVSGNVSEALYRFDKNATSRDYRVMAQYWAGKGEMDRATLNAILSVSKAIAQTQ